MLVNSFIVLLPFIFLSSPLDLFFLHCPSVPCSPCTATTPDLLHGLTPTFLHPTVISLHNTPHLYSLPSLFSNTAFTTHSLHHTPCTICSLNHIQPSQHSLYHTQPAPHTCPSLLPTPHLTCTFSHHHLTVMNLRHTQLPHHTASAIHSLHNTP